MNDVQQSTGLRAEALLQILEVTRKLAAPFDLQSVLTEIGEAARSVLHAERATVWLYEPALDALVLAGTPADRPVTRAPRAGHPRASRRATRAIVNVPDCRLDSAVRPGGGPRLRQRRALHAVGAARGAEFAGRRAAGGGQGRRALSPREDERIAATLASQCVVFIQRERLTRTVAMAEKLDREIKLARDIQMSTLPSDMPTVPGYDMAGQFCPADDTGGDTFDLVTLDDQRLFVLLGDASGHGIGPALSSTQMTGMLRVALRLGADLDSIFTHVNNQLVEDLPEEHFVTAFLGMLDPRSHEVVYHAAGQGPLLHFHAATGECEWRSPTTFPMGYMRYPSLDAPAQHRARAGRRARAHLGRRLRARERRAGAVRHRGRRARREPQPSPADVRAAHAASRGAARFRGRASRRPTTSRSS